MSTCSNMCNCERKFDIDMVMKSKEKQKALKRALQQVCFDSYQMHFDDDGDEI